jgi:hypothetical protein
MKGWRHNNYLPPGKFDSCRFDCFEGFFLYISILIFS